jgi:PIN domain nuclease of toxin-antitoxin system
LKGYLLDTVMMKSIKGMLDVGDPRQWWIQSLQNLGLCPLPQSADHIAAIYDLPPVHRDPFDRALIAQAISEELVLLSTDRQILTYASEPADRARLICGSTEAAPQFATRRYAMLTAYS